MCAYHHPDHCACTSNSLSFALSAFCLYPPHPVNSHVCASSACSGFSWAALERKAANMMLTTWNPLSVSLKDTCPANGLVQGEQGVKQSSFSTKPNKPTALPSGTTAQDIPLLSTGFFERVEGKKEKTQERAGLEDRFCLLQLSFLLAKSGVGEVLK